MAQLRAAIGEEQDPVKKDPVKEFSKEAHRNQQGKKRRSQVDENMSGQPLPKRRQTLFVRKDTKPGRLLKKTMNRQSSVFLSLKNATSKKARKRKKKAPNLDSERMDIGSAVEFTYRQPLDDMEQITEAVEPLRAKGGNCTCIGECTVKMSCFDKTLKEVGIYVSEEAFNYLRLLPMDKFKSLCQNVLRMNIDHFTFENKDNLDPVVAPNAECLSVLTVHGQLDDYGTKTQRRKLKRRFAKYLSQLLDHDDTEQVKVLMVASGCIMFLFTMTAANTERLMHLWKTEPAMVQQGFREFTLDYPQPVIDVATTIGLKQLHSIQTQIQRETSTPELDLEQWSLDGCLVSRSKSPQDEALKDKTQNKAPQDDVTQDEAMEDEATQEEATLEEPPQDAALQDEATQSKNEHDQSKRVHETCTIDGCTFAQDKKLQEESAEDDKGNGSNGRIYIPIVFDWRVLNDCPRSLLLEPRSIIVTGFGGAGKSTLINSLLLANVTTTTFVDGITVTKKLFPDGTFEETTLYPDGTFVAKCMKVHPAVAAAEKAVDNYNDRNELSLHLCLSSAEEADIAARIRSQNPHFSLLDVVYKLLDVWLAQTTMPPPQ